MLNPSYQQANALLRAKGIQSHEAVAIKEGARTVVMVYSGHKALAPKVLNIFHAADFPNAAIDQTGLNIIFD